MNLINQRKIEPSPIFWYSETRIYFVEIFSGGNRMTRKILFVILVAFLIFQTPHLSAQTKTQKKAAPKVPEPSLAITHHTIQIDGKPLKYTATTGYLLLKTKRKNQKQMFFSRLIQKTV